MPKMVFIERDGSQKEVEAPLGLSVLEIAHRNSVDIEGACEGSLACSTCHVIVDPSWFGKLAKPTEDEEDAPTWARTRARHQHQTWAGAQELAETRV